MSVLQEFHILPNQVASMRQLGGKCGLALAVCLTIAGLSLVVFLGARVFGPPLDPGLVRADNEFAFKLFREVMREQGNKNVLISPVSVAIALHMTYNGASGKTKEAMARSLGLEGMSLDEINGANAKLTRLLATPDSGVQVDVANSLWGRRGLSFKPEFIRRALQFYNAEVSNLDFANPDAPTKINSWVARKTGGKISEVVQSFQPDEGSVLVSAASFTGPWMNGFDESFTDRYEFHLPGGRTKYVPMIGKLGTFMFSSGVVSGKSDGPRMIRLPYSNSRMSMYIMLTGGHLDWLCQNLNPAAWDEWISRMRETDDIMLFLPCFQMKYTADLGKALEALGVDLSQPLSVTTIRHGTFAEVADVGAKPVEEVKPVSNGYVFMAGSPFFFAIRDDKTGVILFMGWVADPAPDRPALSR